MALQRTMLIGMCLALASCVVDDAARESVATGPLADIVVIGVEGPFDYANFDRTTGRWIEEELTLRSEFSEGLAPAFIAEKGRFKRVKEGQLFGYVDSAGRTVIPFRFTWANPFVEDRAVVDVVEGTGVIDRKGNWVVKPGAYPIYSDHFTEGLLAYRGEDRRVGFLNLRGEVAIKPTLDLGAFIGFSQGLCLLEGPDGDVYIRRDGSVAFVLPRGVRGEPFSDGRARVEVHVPGEPGWAYGYIDANGRIAIPPKFANAGGFSEGLAPATRSDRAWMFVGNELKDSRNLSTDDQGILTDSTQYGKWGFIGPDGEFVIPDLYDAVGKFSEGLARVKAGDKWGFINKKGELVIKLRFDDVEDFRAGCAIFHEIKRDASGKPLEDEEGVVIKRGVIDRNGNVLIPATLDMISTF